jgi:hypothetical protein
MPKHSANLRQHRRVPTPPRSPTYRRFRGMSHGRRRVNFRRTDLINVLPLGNAPVLNGQMVVLHRPTNMEPLENIDYNKRGRIVGVDPCAQGRDDRMEVNVQCRTKDSCYRNVFFSLDKDEMDADKMDASEMDSYSKGDDDTFKETNMPFSIDNSEPSPVVVPYKKHHTCKQVNKQKLMTDIWKFWLSLRSHIYQDITCNTFPDRNHRTCLYRREAREEFLKLYATVRHQLDGWFGELEKAFHPTETPTGGFEEHDATCPDGLEKLCEEESEESNEN